MRRLIICNLIALSLMAPAHVFATPGGGAESDTSSSASSFEPAQLRAGAPLFVFQLRAPGDEYVLGFLGSLGVGVAFRTSQHWAVAVDLSPSPLDARLGVELDYTFSGWHRSGAVAWSGLQYGVGSLRCETSVNCDVTADGERYWAAGPSMHAGLGYRWENGGGDVAMTLGLATALAYYSVVHAPEGVDADALSGLYVAPMALRFLVSW